MRPEFTDAVIFLIISSMGMMAGLLAWLLSWDVFNAMMGTIVTTILAVLTYAAIVVVLAGPYASY